MKRIFILILFLCACMLNAQNSQFNGFHFQSVMLDQNGIPYNNATLLLKAELFYNNSAGQLIYDENQNVTTNAKGYVEMTVGKGTPLNGGVFSGFNSIAWKDSSYYLVVSVFNSGTSSYDIVAQKNIYTALFSIYSKSTAQKYRLNQLLDVDTTGLVNGSVLKWYNTKWIVAKDSLVKDTVVYASNGLNSVYSDTASFALNAMNIIPSDTAQFAFNSLNSVNSVNALQALNADTSSYSLNAAVALNASNVWRINGNTGTNPATHFVGTSDNNNLKLVTNDTARVTITSSGRVGIGVSNPATDFHLIGKNGFVMNGTYGVGIIPTTGAGTRVMWYPKKSAFRGGTLDAGTPSTYWDDAKVGNYSFVYGKNSEATGLCAMAMGEDNHALSSYAGAVGLGNYVYAGGMYSFAAGHTNLIYSQVSFALGRGNICRGLASGALGYHSEANGDYSRSFGFYTYADGDYSTSMGYQCKALHDGCFIFNDYSSIPGYLNTSGPNQFMAKAAGGFYFYSNSTATTGVTLASGSGSWSSLSDSTKKENFELVNNQEILNSLCNLKIYSWNYKSQNENIRHIGPTAQSFYKSFHLGESERMISSVDADGVSMAAIQALADKTKALEELNGQLESALKEIEALKEERKAFEKKLLILESLYEHNNEIGKR